MADSNAPRCPLGFTGTPPVGHPSIPGFGSSAKATGTAEGSSTQQNTSGFVATLQAYQPSTLLIVDAIFLGICIIAAIYRDDIKAYWTGTGSRVATSAGSGKAR